MLLSPEPSKDLNGGSESIVTALTERSKWGHTQNTGFRCLDATAMIWMSDILLSMSVWRLGPKVTVLFGKAEERLGGGA